MFQDRPYQTQALNATSSEYDKNVRRVLHVMATGTGKTVVFSKLYEHMKSRLAGKMVVLAHTEELVDQNLDKMQAVNPTLKVGKEMAGTHADPDSDIISASVATLGRKGTARLDDIDWAGTDKLIVDEAHHSTSDAYRRVVDRFSGMAPNGRILLGFTATPQRSDGVTLADLYDKVGFVYSLRQAIADGWLVDVKGWRVATDTSLQVVSQSGGDFDKAELSAAVNNPQRNRLIVDAWKTKGRGRKAIAFTVDIKHAVDLAEEFTAAGVVAAAVWGDDPDRAEKLRLHREGKIQVICNCGVLVEGYDDWSVGCILLCRPTQSGVLFAQMVGRGTRLDPSYGCLKEYRADRLPAKTDVICIDFVDGTTRHSLVTLPTLMGLQGTLDPQGRSLFEVVTEMEAAQEENPSIDLTKLTDINNLAALIKSVDMFQIRFPKECESNSDLTWFRAADGGYKIKVPEKFKDSGYVRIQENVLGKWELSGLINKKPFFGNRATFEEVIRVADEQIRQRVIPATLSIVNRESTWQKGKVTDGQKKMLARLFPHKTFPIEQMTAGDASRAIGERLNK